MEVKRMKETRRFLTIIMAMVMVFAAVVMVTTETDGETGETSETITGSELIGKAVDGVLTLDKSYTISSALTITKDMVIDGKDFTITYNGTDRAFDITGSDVKSVSIMDLTIDASKAERGLNISNTVDLSLTLKDVNIIADHYALNVAGGNNGTTVVEEDGVKVAKGTPNGTMTIDVTGGAITGYCAFQTWSHNTTATFDGTTLTGLNKWDNSASNNFATIVVNSGVVGADIDIIGCQVNEKRTAESNPAHEYALLTKSGSEGRVTFTDTTITPAESACVFLAYGSVIIEADEDTKVGTNPVSSDMFTVSGLLASVESVSMDKYYTDLMIAVEDNEDAIIKLSRTAVIDKNTILEGNGNTIEYAGTGKVLDICGSDVKEVTISDLIIDAERAERGINVYNTKDLKLTLNDVDITVDHYALNISDGNNGTVVDQLNYVAGGIPNGTMTISVTGGEITGYCAFQTWSHNTTAIFNGTILTGLNKWDNSAPNNFATVVVNNGVKGASITLSGCTVNDVTANVDNPAHEYAFRAGPNSEGFIVFKNKTTITPAESICVIYTCDGFIVGDDGTTVIRDVDSFADAIHNRFGEGVNTTPIAEAVRDGVTYYYADIQTAMSDNPETMVKLLRNLDVKSDIEILYGLQVPEGLTANATFVAGTDKATLTGIKAGPGGFTLMKGSFIVDGSFISFAEDASSSISLSGDVVLSGVYDVPVQIEEGSVATIPRGQTASFNKGLTIVDVSETSPETTVINVVGGLEGEVEISKGENVAGTITVNAEDPEAVQDLITGSEEIEVNNIKAVPVVPEQGEILTAADVQSALDKYTKVSISDDLVLSSVDDLFIASDNTLILNGANVIVEAATTAGNQGFVVEGSIQGDGYIIVQGYMELDGADIRVSVIEDDGAYISIKNAKKMTVDGDATADLGVGYGNTLVLSNLTVPAGKNIEAYGNVVIGGNVTIQKGAQFKVHPGGNAQIDGALTIEGTAEIRGDTIVNGSVKVYNADGGAILQTDNTAFVIIDSPDFMFEPAITVSGTMDVLKSKSKEATVDNRLIANADVVVEGTLTITGTFNGDIRDKGTVVFNGTVGGNQSSITIYDGVTITVASVTGYGLTIKDEMDDSEFTSEQLQNNKFSDENAVVLNDVKGITVSTELTDTVKTMDNGDKVRYHVMNMTVSGTISAVDDKKVDTSSVTILNDMDGNWPTDVDSKKIVVADVTLGKNVIFVLDGVNIDVDGTVNVIAEGSIIRTAQTVDVDGMIVVGEDAYQYGSSSSNAESELLVNGAHYEVESADMTETTCYYTTLADALAASAEDSDERIEALGTIMVSTELEVPTGITLDTDTAIITIDVDGKITVAVDALLDGGNGTIDVQGMLVIMDKESGLEAPKTFTYQVLNETETTATYSGLVLALQNAVAGDVITLKQDAVISKSVIIPEGVTLEVPKGTKLTIGDAVDKEKVTLTVAGTLKVTGGTVDAIIGDDVNNPITNVVIPGQVILNGDHMFIENSPYQSLFNVSDDYVIFSMRVDGKAVTVMSNLAYAAENATYGIVHVVGDVTGGDVTFTEDEKKSGSEDLVVLVLNAGNTLSVSSITLEGASLVVANTTFTGTVRATADGGVAEIEASKLAGRYIVSSEVQEDVDGKTDLMTVAGETTGKVTLSSGTITVGTLDLVGYVQGAIGVPNTAPSLDYLILNNDDDGSESSISADATLIVPKGRYFLAEGDASEDRLLAIDGTVVVQTELIAAFCGSAINGTVSVENGAKAFMGMRTVVTGTVSVAEKTDDAAAGTMQVGLTFVGTEPSIGAAGTLVGPFETIDEYTGPMVPTPISVTGVIVAYPGSDLSGALINVNDAGESAAESTEFYINGQLYMTAITAMDIQVGSFTNGLGIEIPGLVTPKDATGTYDDITWYTDEAMKNKFTGGNIGSIERLYTTFEAAEVDLVVSAGVGLVVYIDGIEASSGKIDVGTHTVSIAVKAGYDGTDATITVNGQIVSNGGTFTAEVDEKVTIIASGAVPAQSGSTVVVSDDDGMKLTDILLIVLVVLIVIMAIIVALRIMRS